MIWKTILLKTIRIGLATCFLACIIPRLAVQAADPIPLMDMANQLAKQMESDFNNPREVRWDMADTIEEWIGRWQEDYPLVLDRTQLNLKGDMQGESLLLTDSKKVGHGIELICVYRQEQLVYLGIQVFGEEEFTSQPFAYALGQNFKLLAQLVDGVLAKDNLIIDKQTLDQDQNFKLSYYWINNQLSHYLLNDFLVTHHYPSGEPQMTLEQAEVIETQKDEEVTMTKEKEGSIEDDRLLSDRLLSLIPVQLNNTSLPDLRTYQSNLDKLQVQIAAIQSAQDDTSYEAMISRPEIIDLLGQAQTSHVQEGLLKEHYYFMSNTQLVHVDLTYQADHLLSLSYTRFDNHFFKKLPVHYEQKIQSASLPIAFDKLQSILGPPTRWTYYLGSKLTYYSWLRADMDTTNIVATIKEDQVIAIDPPIDPS